MKMGIFGNTYAQLVKLGKDAVRETMAPMRAKEMKLKAQTRLAELESKIAEGEQRVVELCSVYPIDYDKVVDAMDATGLLKRRKEQFELIVAELFPAESATA
jgi:uncharacterized coiled-coil protein SlyX